MGFCLDTMGHWLGTGSGRPHTSSAWIVWTAGPALWGGAGPARLLWSPVEGGLPLLVFPAILPTVLQFSTGGCGAWMAPRVPTGQCPGAASTVSTWLQAQHS